MQVIPAEELDRIAAVSHQNPHEILGPHLSGGGVVVRAFQPDALAVRVIPDDPVLRSRDMQRVHPGGIFEAVFPGVAAVFPYRLHVSLPQREVWIRDPYAFAPLLGDLDLHLAAEGRHRELHRHLGAHIGEHGGVSGTSFAVWAPNAERVSVVGDFNQWDGRLAAMRRMGQGIWEIFLPGVGEGALYKYEISTPGVTLHMKSDPYANAMELRPQTASKVVTRRYEFTDAEWMKTRAEAPTRSRPLSIYEVHLGSFMRVPRKIAPGEPPPLPEHSLRWLTYRELGDKLVDYVAGLGFTHIELLPVLEHPYDGSWGYQASGYFAPTSRYGEPDDLRYFIDRCHARGIGVLLDWTPAHFPKDAFALGRFDGTPLYEHEDPRRGEHRQWETFIFDYGKNEVKNFLISSALYWMEEFHIDGLRVDAVASMLYLDYCSEQPGDWLPNKYGGRENLEAVAFLRELCDAVHEKFPGVILCAEESSTWPGVTRPTYVGGLGFDFKWNMGWMHDTLEYFALDPIHRAFHHRLITFGLTYAFSESYILPLSHDEVVHLKKSLLSKMPGDRWKMHASLRAMYGLMWAHPGKKLLFMGGEIGQWKEWNFTTELDWSLLQEPDHAGLQRLIGDLNRTYRKYPALWELDDDPAGFTWIDPNDAIQSVASFVRFPRAAGNSETPAPRRLPKGIFVVMCGNFTPVPRYGYRLGVPRRCRYLEVINTDARHYGGSGMGNLGVVDVQDVPAHGFPQSIVLTLPPLSALWLVPEASEDPPESIVDEDASAEPIEKEEPPAEPVDGSVPPPVEGAAG